MSQVVQLGGGRPRKPTAQKALAGTLRRDRINPSEPTPAPIALPDPPKGLTKHERAAWVELKALIDPMRIATAADVVAFRGMVQDAGILEGLRASYIKAGGTPVYVEDTAAGKQIRQRPELALIATYRKLLFLHFARWGLDPSDRSRVSALKEVRPTTDPHAKWRLAGGVPG